jgi:7-cyano-7-deazaguanine reductase
MTETHTIKRLNQSELGKPAVYAGTYDSTLLFPLPRQEKRVELGIGEGLPFTGFDLWTHYEVSWLNAKGKPIVAIAEILYPCESPYIIESKSMKLYFNSFNQTKFKDISNIQATISRDLSAAVGMPVQVELTDLLDALDQDLHAKMEGICLDNLDVSCTQYRVDSNLLKTQSQIVTESVYSNLLKSNCLITHQPDWATVQIRYTGPQIEHQALLQYLISFRMHNEFHEQCIERIFVDIMTRCQPQDLLVYGRYTRRGGLDINVLRSKYPVSSSQYNLRLIRQ